MKDKAKPINSEKKKRIKRCILTIRPEARENAFIEAAMQLYNKHNSYLPIKTKAGLLLKLAEIYPDQVKMIEDLRGRVSGLMEHCADYHTSSVSLVEAFKTLEKLNAKIAKVDQLDPDHEEE